MTCQFSRMCWLAAFLLLSSPLVFCKCITAAERPPNVVLIIADDKYLESAAAKQKCRIFGTFSANILVCELAPSEANSGRLT